MEAVGQAEIATSGLIGGRLPSPGSRAVTLIQAEHLPVLTYRAQIDPEDLRRNLIVLGLNLSASPRRVLRIRPTRLRITGPCAPCLKMETTLGSGGYNAMRGRDGWTAEVVTLGQAIKGGPVTVIP